MTCFDARIESSGSDSISKNQRIRLFNQYDSLVSVDAAVQKDIQVI